MSDGQIPPDSWIAIVERLARIEATLEQIRRDREEQQREHDDHEGRIRGLERWRWSWPASALTAVASVVAVAYETFGK